jgi:hypothetical protein
VGRRAEVARPSRSARARRLPKSFAFGLGTQSQVAPLNSLQRGGRSPRRLCTRRDLNPHTLRYRNLNPVGVYRDAVRCSEPAGSRSSWLPLAASRYASWTIQRRFPRLLTTAAGRCRCSGTAGRLGAARTECRPWERRLRLRGATAGGLFVPVRTISSRVAVTGRAELS